MTPDWIQLVGTTVAELLQNTAVPLAMVAGFTLSFYHYLADGVIGKRKNKPNKAKSTSPAAT
jgi:hypothetical protein